MSSFCSRMSFMALLILTSVNVMAAEPVPASHLLFQRGYKNSQGNVIIIGQKSLGKAQVHGNEVDFSAQNYYFGDTDLNLHPLIETGSYYDDAAKMIAVSFYAYKAVHHPTVMKLFDPKIVIEHKFEGNVMTDTYNVMSGEELVMLQSQMATKGAQIIPSPDLSSTGEAIFVFQTLDNRTTIVISRNVIDKEDVYMRVDKESISKIIKGEDRLGKSVFIAENGDTIELDKGLTSGRYQEAKFVRNGKAQTVMIANIPEGKSIFTDYRGGVPQIISPLDVFHGTNSGSKPLENGMMQGAVLKPSNLCDKALSGAGKFVKGLFRK